jgi:hypothetical protein
MSWLPVARRPTVSHVSMIRRSDPGIQEMPEFAAHHAAEPSWRAISSTTFRTVIGVGLEAAQLARPAQAKEPRLGQCLRCRCREASVSLALVGVRSKERTELPRHEDKRVPECGSALRHGGRRDLLGRHAARPR